MKGEEVQFWRKSIDNAQKFMAPKHKEWRKLLAMYRMEFEVPGLDKDQIVRISRFYPLTRQIISSIAYIIHMFFYVWKTPTVSFKLKS